VRRPAAADVEDLPVDEVGDGAFDGGAEAVEGVVAGFAYRAEVPAWWFAVWRERPAALIPLVGQHAGTAVG
jgi:hypothetical protein